MQVPQIRKMGWYIQWGRYPLQHLKLSDHLDMLSVQLTASYTMARKVNCYLLVSIIKNSTDKWKSGKFLPLASQPWCVNMHIFSKLWFCTSCLELRIVDCTKVMSAAKSWIYQPLLVNCYLNCSTDECFVIMWLLSNITQYVWHLPSWTFKEY